MSDYLPADVQDRIRTLAQKYAKKDPNIAQLSVALNPVTGELMEPASSPVVKAPKRYTLKEGYSKQKEASWIKVYGMDDFVKENLHEWLS